MFQKRNEATLASVRSADTFIYPEQLSSGLPASSIFHNPRDSEHHRVRQCMCLYPIYQAANERCLHGSVTQVWPRESLSVDADSACGGDEDDEDEDEREVKENRVCCGSCRSKITATKLVL